jgi:hypothetical protein
MTIGAAGSKDPEVRPAQPHQSVRRHPGIDADELDIWFSRHRSVFVAVYVVVFGLFSVLLAIGWSLIPELPHLAIAAASGRFAEPPPNVLYFFNGELPIDYTAVGISLIYVLSQGFLVWGVGAVYLERHRHGRRTTVSICIIAGAAAFLVFGALSLTAITVQTAENRYIGPYPEWYSRALDTSSVVLVLISGWFFLDHCCNYLLV